MVVTTGTKHVLTTDNMTLAWHEWKNQPIAEHSWPNWKTHWTVVFAKMRDVNCMMARGLTFGANATEEAKQARQIALSLDNLANASIQQTLTINNLMETNAQLMKALKQMQTTMVQMFPTHSIPTILPNSTAHGHPFYLAGALKHHQTRLEQTRLLLVAWIQG